MVISISHKTTKAAKKRLEEIKNRNDASSAEPPPGETSSRSDSHKLVPTTGSKAEPNITPSNSPKDRYRCFKECWLTNPLFDMALLQDSVAAMPLPNKAPFCYLLVVFGASIDLGLIVFLLGLQS